MKTTLPEPPDEPQVYIFPASLHQHPFWLLEQIMTTAAYNIPVKLSLREDVDTDKLRRVIDYVVQRHEIFRSYFRMIDGQLRLIIDDRVQPALQIHPLDNATEDYINETIYQLASQRFALEKGPLARFHLIHVADKHYILLLILHHIICDEWSINILSRELLTLYAAPALHDNLLPDLPIQYADYAVWQHDWLTDETYKQQLAYWKTHLEGAPSDLPLQTSYPRPASPTYNGDAITLSLSDDLIQHINQFVAQQRTTASIIGSACLQILIYWHSQRTDFTFGMPVANRRRREVQDLIGLFLNTVVIRSDIAPSQSFFDLLQAVNQTSQQAYNHQDIPFDKLVEHIAGQRDRTDSPLFQMMYVFIAINGTDTNQGFDTSGGNVNLKIARFDCSFFFSPQHRTLAIEYNTDLFEAGYIENLLTHWAHILATVLQNPQIPIQDPALLPPAHYQQLVHTWNETQYAFPPARPVITLIEEQARRTPAAPALFMATDLALTFEELIDRVHHVARHLQAHHIGAGQRVAVALQRSPQLIVALLAIQRVGGTYIPIDLQHPPARQTYLLNDARAPFILSHRDYSLSNDLIADRTVLWIETLLATPSDVDLAPLPPDIVDYPLYIMYTSGSTGHPKGVINTHHGVYNRLLWMQRVYNFTSRDTFLQKTRYSFDVSVWEMFMPLITGAKLVLAAPDREADMPYLIRLIQQKNITLVHFVPSMLNLFLREPDVADCQSLRRVICSGEALTAHQRNRFYQLFSNTELHNLYGPTEAAIEVSAFVCQPGDDERMHPPVGKPIDNVRLYVLDDNLQVVPAGAEGELYIGGVAVAEGYNQLPRQTACVFLPDPFAHTPGQRLYKTGDWVRRDVEGTLHYIGRRDYQIKFHGIRIETGEIEVALCEDPLVTAAVVTTSGQGETMQLIAYVEVPHPDAHINMENRLRQHLYESIPPSMIPHQIRCVPQFPLNANGKIDRKQLTANFASPAPDRVSSYQAPRTPRQQQLAAIWEHILQQQPVGLNDNFFMLGGHSLLAIKIVNRIKKEFNIDLVLRALFEYPTIALLDAHIAQAYRSHRPTSAIPVLARDRDSYALSFAQERMWFLTRFTPQDTLYHVSSALHLHERLEPARLQTALERVIERHDVLRSVIITNADGLPEQRVEDNVRVPLIHVKGDRSRREADIRDWIEQPLDLQAGMTTRFVLLEYAPDDWLLIITLHHILCDEWSLRILQRELITLYQNPTARLDPLTHQYIDFAQWQRDWLTGPAARASLHYWQQELADLPPELELPAASSSDEALSASASVIEQRLSATLSEKLITFAHRHQITPFTAVFASFALALYQYTQQRDFTIGIPVTERHQAEFEQMIGLFVNTLVMRVRIDTDRPVTDFLQSIHQTMIDGFTHQMIPFEYLVQTVSTERNLEQNPLFQVMLSFVQIEADDTPATLDYEILDLPVEQTKFDISAFAFNHPAGLLLSLQYRTTRFSQTLIQHLLDSWQHILSQILMAADQRVTRYLRVTPAITRQLLQLSNIQTIQPPSSHRFIHEHFAHQVATQPAAIALRYETKTFTFAQLDALSNQVARQLQTFQVGPATRVAVYTHRTPQWVIVFLAIIKIGATCVPLAPIYPMQRLHDMLDDVDAHLLLHDNTIPPQLLTHSSAMHCLALDRLMTDAETRETTALASSIYASAPMYILYTSGSTGKPRGVSITYANACAYLAWCHTRYQTPGNGVIPLFTSIGFDLSMTALLLPLTTGKTLWLLANNTPQSWFETLADNQDRISLLKMTPSHLHLLNLSDGFASIARRTDMLILGGEALTQETINLWVQHNPTTHIINEYGPTETTVGCTIEVIQPDSVRPRLPVGRPIHQAAIYILDEQLNLLPPGAEGELFIGGYTVGAGYWNDPRRTALAFMPDPFSNEPGARMYRSGDRGRYLPNGKLDYLGRIDDQVKLRGYRIELNEIASVLERYPGIKRAVVRLIDLAPAATDRNRHLVACYEAATPVDLSRLKQHLQAHLPHYMHPQHHIHVAQIPVNAHGKVDWKALEAQLNPANWHQEQTFLAPETTVEEILQRIWMSVLPGSQISTDADFFALGGHSLSAMRVIIAIEEHFSINFSLRTFFKHPTIKTQALAIEEIILDELEALSDEEVRTQLDNT